jgi:hypothetical protein
LDFYKAVVESTLILASLSKGNFLVGIGFIGSNVDVLFALMKRERALMELVKNPQEISPILDDISKCFLELFNKLANGILERKGVISCGTPVAFPAFGGKLLSDSSKMLSLKSFKEMIVPSLKRELTVIKDAIYGLDNAPHLLPALLELNELRFIEWHPPTIYDAQRNLFYKDFLSKESLKVCHEIQESRRKLILTGLSPPQAENLLSVLKKDGLMLSIEAENPREAERLSKTFRKYCSF